MTRVALYARYSSDSQSVASIDDQFRICRDQAARERWRVVGTYKDAAISGASVTLRPGIQALLQDAQAGQFEIVLAEALDRVSRDQADVAKSPRAIAADLNAEGIPGPLGRAWGDTSIRGHVCRGTGILNNELYAGVLVWNRLRYIKNPTTGKRVSRVNPESEWIRSEVPELRIVDEELWQAVRQRQAEIARQFENVTKGVRAWRARYVNELRRPSFLFSGLLTCGCCGGRYGIITRDRYGCLNRYRRGTCDNGRTIRRDDIESRVMAGLTEKLVSADAVGDAVRAYAEELNRQNRERRAQTEIDRKALAKVERGIAGIMAAIEDGMYQPAMKARMEDLERRKAEIMTRMTEATEDVPDIHPNIAEIYRAKVIRLTEALAEPELYSEAADAIRSLVGEVVLTPGERRGEIKAVLRGELMGILDFVTERRRRPKPEIITKGVARPRNHREPNSRIGS